MKVKKTYLEIFKFIAAATAYNKKHQDENTLVFSLKQAIKQIQKDEISEQYAEKLNDIHLDHCSVDEKTHVILRDKEGNLQFTVDAQRKVNKLSKELLQETVEVHQRIREGNEALIPSLTDTEREAFSEIVIPKQVEE